MKWLLLRLLIFALLISSFQNNSIAQNGVPTYQFGTFNPFNNSTINLPCGQNCTDIKFQVPHIKATSDYLLTSIPYNPFPYVTPGGTEYAPLYCDDTYSNTISLPFNFCFFDSVFNKAVVGSNAILTFDYQTNGSGTCDNSYVITVPIPNGGTTPCVQGTRYYPRSAIMLCYSDFDPTTNVNNGCQANNASPLDRKIEWRVEGTAPARRFVVSFYHIGTFGNSSSSAMNTCEMVLYETTGMIDFYFLNKTVNSTTNGGKAIMGIQNWLRDYAVYHPDRNSAVWQAVNEGWRFTPSAGQSRFISSELLTMSNSHVAWGDTTTTVAGTLDIRFPNICTSTPSTQYIVRTFFSSCEDPSSLIFNQDTVTINRTTNLNATATSTASACGPGSGTIAVTVPAGLGSAPFGFSIDGGTTVSGPTGNYTFTNVTSGTHTVFVTDNTGCSSTLTVNVALNGVLTITAITTGTTCAGVNNGVITVTPPVGTPPFQYSINGLPFQSSNIFPNVSAGSYTIVVHDAVGCSGTLTVSVTGGAAITANTAATPTSCNGASNGSITVTPTSGTAPYQYSLDGLAYQAGNIFTGVSAGTHYIIVKDANGCITNTMSQVVAAGAAITGTAATTPTSCAGVNNGTITVTPGGGTGPYQYSLDGLPPQSSNIFTNVSGGSHNVVFTDATGCISATISVNIVTGAPPSANILSTPTSCAGVNNGTITVNPTSGSAPYQYSLDGGFYQPGNVFTNVTAGPHIVSFQDALGCSSPNFPVNVSAGSGISGTAAFTPTSCNGAQDGTITVTPTSGTAPYQYSLDGGLYQTGNIFTNVTSGNHTVSFKDVNGCTSPGINVTVAAGPSLTGTATSTQASCTGVNNATITVTPSTGTGPYQYALDGGAYQQGNLFTGIAPGSHNVIFKDATGCTSSTIPVTVTAGPGPSGTAVASPASCPDVSNGIVTITVIGGGLQPDQFIVDGAPPVISNIITGLGAGNHTVQIIDAAGCLSPNIPVTVTSGPSLNVTVTPVNTSCNGANNGGITLTPTTGIGPFQYSLNGGAFQYGNVFSNLAPGNYTINAHDINGCAANNLPATIVAGAGLTATLNAANINCNGQTNGSITVNLTSSATPPVQYSLDNVNFQTSNIFNGLAAGNYTAYFKDNLGCTGSQTITLTQPPALTMNVATQPVRCNGQSNGTITVSAAGGTSPYQYSLDNITYQAANIFNVAAGTYTVYVRDNNNCLVSQSTVNVTQPAVLTANATTQNSTCDGGSNGVINITAGGGTAAYQYSINGTTFQASNIFNVTQGAYTVTVKDVNNCTVTTNATVALTNNLTFTRGNDTTICEGSSAQLYVITNATQFSWTHAADLNNAAIANPVASPVVPTQYTVTATLGTCTATGTINVNVNTAPIANAGLPNIEICFGQNAQLNASGGVSYQWTPPTYLDNPASSNPTVVQPQQSIQYSLTVTDANGCVSLVPGAVGVTVTPPIKVSVSPRDTIVTEGDQIQLNAVSIATNYSWTNGATLSNPNIANPVATMPPGSLGNVYVYTVTATTAAGCAGTASTVVLKVYKGPDLYVPNAFTPNGDGLNEVFRPIPVGIKKLNYFRIYNRAGRLLYSTSEMNAGWDGTYQGVQQPPAVYVWVVQGLNKDDKPVTKKGTVVLIR